MTNPKDTKEEIGCAACGFLFPCVCTKLFESQYPATHFPGCHKVHIECA